MYYEIFDEFVQSDETKKPLSVLPLVNKSYLDSFFDLRSILYREYPLEQEIERLTQKKHQFLYYQKLINGVSKSAFVGFNVFNLKDDIFNKRGRIKVPDHDLELYLGDPCLFFTSDKEFNYQTSQFQKWEDEIFKIKDSLDSLLNVQITREGFRANLYRTLEIIYSLRSSAARRTNWVVFLHELIVHQKSFNAEELKSKYELSQLPGKKIFKLTDRNFPTQNYLEFNYLKELGKISTAAIAASLKLPEEGSPLEKFSAFNKGILGKIPLCHFFLNEHMFEYKEEFDFNLYYDVFVKPWSPGKDIKICFRENGTDLNRTLPIDEFSRELRQKNYSLIQGFYADENKIYYSAEPKMVKDLSPA